MSTSISFSGWFVVIVIALLVIRAVVRHVLAQRAADRMARRVWDRLTADPEFVAGMDRARDDFANGRTVTFAHNSITGNADNSITWNSTGEALIEVDCE